MKLLVFLIPFLFSISLFFSWQVFSFFGNSRNFFKDKPDFRKLHLSQKLRLGGITFGVIYIVCVSLFFIDDVGMYWYLVGGFFICFLGVLDDFKELSWKVKLFVQSIIGINIILYFYSTVSVVQFFSINVTFDKVLIFALFFIWFIGVTNSVNLIDGMDGLAAGSFVIVLVGSIVHGVIMRNDLFVFTNAMLATSLVSFLIFNKRPAKFFMGDGGSLLLGFHLAVLPLVFLSGTDASLPINVTPFIILSSYFIIDTLRVIFLRIKEKLNPMHPDKNHIHHNLLNSIGSYNGTLLIIFLLVSLSSLLMLLDVKYRFGFIALYFFLVLLGIFIFFPIVLQLFFKVCNFICLFFRTQLKKEIPSKNVYLIDSMFRGCLFLYLFCFLLLTQINELTFTYWFYVLPGLLISLIFVVLSNDKNMKKIILVLNFIFFIGIFVFGTKTDFFWSDMIVLLKNGVLLLFVFLIIFKLLLRRSSLLLRFWNVYDILFFCLMMQFICFYFFFHDFPLFEFFEIYILYLAFQIFYRAELGFWNIKVR
ncbi:undecaprenyl/decaprenyl-phosphate alpha-N-acetylglucosaminyl 1-phosphate transferase [bacterium]|jgi:UDP-GlcNAc:undecaprenyl-phosphate/decaprenyl-phosphate GlcNAc-1-phosphate transferase|nr:undecaprenyl/decaprenyl-phosphate alpha-N-acetylglucosaminyl 1-phosphate transferase [bacterium]